jgi:hypothetical protein
MHCFVLQLLDVARTLNGKDCFVLQLLDVARTLNGKDCFVLQLLDVARALNGKDCFVLQLLDVARTLNGKDFDGDGKGDYSICFNATMNCRVPYLIHAIWGSMMQTQGPPQGVYFHPATMQPFTKTEALVEALGVYGSLFPYMDNTSRCYSYDEAFAAGMGMLAATRLRSTSGAQHHEQWACTAVSLCNSCNSNGMWSNQHHHSFIPAFHPSIATCVWEPL